MQVDQYGYEMRSRLDRFAESVPAHFLKLDWETQMVKIRPAGNSVNRRVLAAASPPHCPTINACMLILGYSLTVLIEVAIFAS